MGATWVALTPFGRVADLSGTGVDFTFEAPFERNRRDVARAVEMAHARGLRVMLVPHLWVESGDWRAQIDPKSEAGWARWAESYTRFVRAWASVAEATHADMFSAGVELRSWVTTAHGPSFTRLLREVRRVYHGILTYSANWDDVGAGRRARRRRRHRDQRVLPARRRGGRHRGEHGRPRARPCATRSTSSPTTWGKPVLFTEIGYTTRPDPALRPWEWPDAMSHVDGRRGRASHGVPSAHRADARRAGLRWLLRVAGVRGPRRHVAGGPVGLLAARQAGRARRARRLRRAVGLRSVVEGAVGRRGADGRDLSVEIATRALIERRTRRASGWSARTG